MKLITKQVITAAVMGFAVPWVILVSITSLASRESKTTGEESEGRETFSIQSSSDISINVVTDGKAESMALESYITGVVLAEMPAEFEQDALKAQAVVARTYALRRLEQGGKHENGPVCTDPNCCQGYRSPEQYLSRGGSVEDVAKIEKAVYDTAGQVLTYEGALIEATYFSCSGGQTEDAMAVWGADIPYLQSTASPGEEDASHYSDTVTMTVEEFIACVDTRLPADPSDWFGAVTYTAGGGVDTIRIGERIYKGTEVRAMLALRSTDFTIRYTGKDIEIVTHGFGHRVGMSQYGADAMAAAGNSYHEILTHYYQGTQISDYKAMGN